MISTIEHDLKSYKCIHHIIFIRLIICVCTVDSIHSTISATTYVDIRRLAMVSTGWKRASSDNPATADPRILAFDLDLPDGVGLVAMTP